MKYFTLYKILLLILIFYLFACSSSNLTIDEHFNTPYDMEFVSENKIAFIVNRDSGTLVLFNMDDSSFYDTNPNLDNAQSIYVGGNPIAIAYNKKEGHKYNVYVATNIDSRWLIAGVNVELLSDGAFSHSLMVLGTESIADVGDSHFINEDSKSDPTLTKLKLIPNNIDTASWILSYKGNDLFELEKNIIGNPSNEIISNTISSNSSFNNDSLSFDISDGFLSLDKNDRFIFQSSSIYPLFVDLEIKDIFILNNSLLLLLNKDNKSFVFTYDTLDFSTPPTEIELSGNPSTIKEIGNKIFFLDFVGNIKEDGTKEYYSQYISNESLPTDNSSITKELYEYPIRDMVYDENEDLYILIDPEKNKVVAIDGETQDEVATYLLKEMPVNLAIVPNVSFSNFNYLVGGDIRALLLVTTIQGNIYLFDNLNLRENGNFSLIDANIVGSNKESKAGDLVFYDEGVASNPKIKALWTEDSVTKDENWVIEYQGKIPFSESKSGILNGGVFSDSAINFNLLKVNVKYSDLELKSENDSYDTIVILGDTLKDVELPILFINNNNELLVENSEISGNYENINYIIRSYNSYTVSGSISGFQHNRAIEGESYKSDNEEISLYIQGSFLNPTTMGDLFSFFTKSGIEPLKIGRMAGKSVIIQDSEDIYMYAMSTASNGIYEIDLNKLRVKQKIR